MKTKFLGILTVLALALVLARGAAAATVNVQFNNVGGQGIDFVFDITGNTITFNSVTGAPAAYGGFVRFDKIGFGGTGITALSSYSSGSQTWKFGCSNNKFDGFGYTADCLSGSTAHNPSTPTGSFWKLNHAVTTPIDVHAIFSNGCTFFASSTGPNNTGGLSGACTASAPVPEPSSLVLFGGGLLGLAAFIRRRPALWRGL